jgi:Predicted DNA binding protein
LDREVSRDYPDATINVMTAMPGSDAAFAVLTLQSEALDTLLAAIQSHDKITDVSILQQTDEKITVQIETVSPPLLLLAAKVSGMPIEFPVTITNARATVDVTGSHERLSELASQFRASELEFNIEYIQERLHTTQLLSETQQQLVLQAVEHGYYDTPRNCSLSEVADAAGIAKSTCSETLHRAEETMIKHFVDDIPTPVESENRITSSDRVENPERTG